MGMSSSPYISFFDANLDRLTLLVPLAMAAALSNPRAATTMVLVMAALVEVATTALARMSPAAMEVEIGTPMELAAVTTVVVLRHHGTRVRRPAAAAGKVQTLPFYLCSMDA